MTINGLAPELLSEIFIHMSNTHDVFTLSGLRRHEAFLSAICLTCEHWKNVAYGLPALWSIILIDNSFNLPRIKTGLKRARNAGLHIALMEALSEANSPIFWVVWDRLKAHHLQWRTLYIGAILFVQNQDALKSFLPADLPRLNKADIRVNTEFGQAEHWPIIMAPQLQEYSCAHSTFMPFPPTSALTFLKISGWAEWLPPYLSDCPNIETLIITHGGFDMDTRRPTSMPSLRHLMFARCSGSGITATLTNLEAENLETISMQINQSNNSPLLPDHEGWSLFPNLSKITYRGKSIYEVNRLLLALSNPESVVVELEWTQMAAIRTLTREAFEFVDAGFRAVEEKCKELKWLNDAREWEEYFMSLKEARDHYNGLSLS